MQIFGLLSLRVFFSFPCMLQKHFSNLVNQHTQNKTHYFWNKTNGIYSFLVYLAIYSHERKAIWEYRKMIVT